MEWPKRIEHYQIEGKLGEGGMGEVYRAWDEDLERSVAIKFIHQHRWQSASGQRRFRREALTVARLNHPAIVQIYHKLRWEENEGIVMELVEGKTLAQLLRGGPLAPEQALPWLKEVAEGLAYAHGEGFIHRDLKAENVMITHTGYAKILDFGLAKQLSTAELSLSEEGTILGTLHTMSPEQAQAQELDHRADLFSLGVLFYQVLTGQAPFRAPTDRDTLVKVLHHHPPRACDVNPEIPPELSRMIGRLLAKQPEHRPQSGQEVVDVLARLTTSSTSPSSLPTPAEDPSPGRSAGLELRSTPTVGGRPEKNKRASPDPDVPTAATAQMRTGSLFGRPGAIAVLLVLAALSAVVLLRESHRPAVVVLDFENRSGQSGEAWLSTAIAERLSAVLTADDGLRHPSGLGLHELRRAMGPRGTPLAAEDLERLALYLRPDFVVLGSYELVEAGSRLQTSFLLQNAATGEVKARVESQRDRERLPEIVQRAAAELRRELGLGELRAQALQKVEVRFPRHPEAARLYWQALGEQRWNDDWAARDLLEKAIALEPEHPLLHSALARSLAARGYVAEEREASRRARELAAGLPRRTRLEIEARSHWSSREWEQAEAIYHTLFQDFPDEIHYGIWLARARSRTRRFHDALKVLEDLRQSHPPPVGRGLIHLVEAEIHLRSNDFEKARRIAARAVEEGASVAPFLEARARILEGKIFDAQSEFDQALEALESARLLYEQAGNRWGALEAYGLLRNVYSKTGDFEEAANQASKLIQIYRDNGDRSNEATMRVNRANDWASLGRYEEAIVEFDAAREIFEETGAPHKAAAASMGGGVASHQSGKLMEARIRYQKALATYTELGDEGNAARARTNLGEILFWTGEADKAREEFEASLRTFERLGDRSMSAYLCVRLGEVFASRDQPDTARDWFDQALRVQEELALPVEIARTRLALARLEIDQENFGSARDEAKEAEQTFWTRKMNDDAVLAKIVRARALLAQRSSDLREAREIVDDARLHAGTSADFRVRLEVAILAARLEMVERPGNVAAALSRLEQIAADASMGDYFPYVFEAHLALAEGELLAGRTAAAHRILDELRAEAGQRGWEVMVRKAKALSSFES